MDGPNLIARWREAGEWWNHGPQCETVRWIDDRGVRREETRELPSLALEIDSKQSPLDESRTEEYSLRVRKTRDEKASAECGQFSPAYYEARSRERRGLPDPVREPLPTGFAALHLMSGYAFGRSLILAEELGNLAANRGCVAAAIADPFSLVGAVEFARACRKGGVKPLIGASIEVPEGGELVLIARSKRGYSMLSQLITECHTRELRGYPLATWPRLERFSADLICLTGGDTGPLNRFLARRDFRAAEALIDRILGVFGGSNVFLEVERSELPWQISVNQRIAELAASRDLLVVAGGIVTHPRLGDFPAQDLLACAETLATVDEVIGRKPARDPSQPSALRWPERSLNAERFFPNLREYQERFADHPDWQANALRVADRCDDDVLPSRTQLPRLYDDPAHVLREITFAGALRLYPKINQTIRRRLEFELERIIRLDFANHFLVAWDTCRWAQDQGIQMSGRGSVVDSAVSYCLGFSRIDAIRHRLHFDRFLPDDGSKRPDIDIDFESRRRDDVRGYMTQKYGAERVATVAAVGAFATRGIIREIGKALGLSPELIGYVAKRIHGGVPADQIEAAIERKPELRDSQIPRDRLRWIFRLSERLMDVPRNIRAHSSGVVISDRPLCETVPVMWSASNPMDPGDAGLRIIQWDKRTAKHYFDKFDILCLRGQDVLSGTEQRIRSRQMDFDVQRVPVDDPETYRAMRSGELIGIPQSASPAMRQAHIRIRTQNLHDASLVQAGIRPGVGGAVKINQLIARRRGLEAYSFSHPELERILGLTYGIVVFQEQVDQLLQAFGNLSSGEAEDIRDAIHKRRREDYGQQIREELLARIRAQGHSESVAQEVFEYIAGFKGYGFAQGHALAFAEISIRSIYCQQNYPAEYFAALLSAQPAGYYGPCTLVNEARSRGVTMLPPCVMRSQEGFSVEDVTRDGLTLPGGGIRVGLMQIHGLSKETRERILAYAEVSAVSGPADTPPVHAAIPKV